MDTPIKPLPPVSAETQAFWDACSEGRLTIQQCTACGHKQFYPRLLCTKCMSDQLGWIDTCGRGSIKSFTIIRRAVSAAFEPDVPYVVALVQLEEGPTLMSNILNCNPESLTIGQSVQLTFERRSEDIAIPQFQPES